MVELLSLIFILIFLNFLQLTCNNTPMDKKVSLQQKNKSYGGIRGTKLALYERSLLTGFSP